MVCTTKEVVPHGGWDYKAGESNNNPAVNVAFVNVTAENEENKEFFKSTPSASVQLAIVREEAAAIFEVGKEYYVDFTPAN